MIGKDSNVVSIQSQVRRKLTDPYLEELQEQAEAGSSMWELEKGEFSKIRTFYLKINDHTRLTSSRRRRDRYDVSSS